MSFIKSKETKIRVSFKQALKILMPYVKNKIFFQIKMISVIVIYLIFFQLFILGIPIQEAAVITAGILLVVVGLAFFMEGLLIGIMPLGEYCGKQLPRKVKLPSILLFAFLIGVVATLAEPSISVLNAAGSYVKANEAPLLFALLNRYSLELVLAICAGVGIAVLFGVLRFIYQWSLKPFIFLLIPLLLVGTLLAFYNKTISVICGLAWDAGGITTGPVTVPLVIALGIGISRSIGDTRSNTAGLGVVTLASCFPIMTVLILSGFLSSSVPKPADEKEFFINNTKLTVLFTDKKQETGYVLANCQRDTAEIYIHKNNIDENKLLESMIENPQIIFKYFKSQAAFRTWVTSVPQLSAFMQLHEHRFAEKLAATPGAAGATFITNVRLAIQAIFPLTLFLLGVLAFLLKERIPRLDEIFLGILLSTIGMTLFNQGMELGLSNLGKQVGSTLPATFKAIEIPGEQKIINNFSEDIVENAITASGEKEKFFYAKDKNNYLAIPFDENNYDAALQRYIYTPLKGPLAGKQNPISGYLILLIFAFFMGYSVTLAEPALNALGLTLEELTVGTFKRSLLMQSVAAGVGIGMGFGIFKIIFNIPLIWLLLPPYILLLFLTYISNEDFVNIAWDSAGVTTGPITVPLVIAMGLGVGNQIGAPDGFGILAMASAYPILTVLIVGLVVEYRHREVLKESLSEPEKTKDVLENVNETL